VEPAITVVATAARASTRAGAARLAADSGEPGRVQPARYRHMPELPAHPTGHVEAGAARRGRGKLTRPKSLVISVVGVAAHVASGRLARYVVVSVCTVRSTTELPQSKVKRRDR
jgi:hypothetical protein